MYIYIYVYGYVHLHIYIYIHTYSVILLQVLRSRCAQPARSGEKRELGKGEGWGCGIFLPFSDPNVCPYTVIIVGEKMCVKWFAILVSACSARFVCGFGEGLKDGHLMKPDEI